MATESLFLNPPHSHDPTHISHVAGIPQSMVTQLPTEVQALLWGLQESTSVVFASYTRLVEMKDERFDRLIPMPGKFNNDSQPYSECAFFNYVNSLKAERQYLLDEALPDWRQKASRIDPRTHEDITYMSRDKEKSFNEWFSKLQATVAVWSDTASKIHPPEFEETVREYRSTSPDTPT